VNTNCFAVVAAAGLGQRLRSETNNIPKAFFRLETPKGEFSLLTLSVLALAESELFSGIIVCCAKEFHDSEALEIKKLIGSNILIEFIEGGDSRQKTVWNALNYLKGRASFVAIHDAARPFVTRKALEDVVHAGVTSSAALLVEPVTSTLKKIEEGKISLTLLRNEYALAQTPQVFEFNLIYHAHLEAFEQNYHVTDDAELVERKGLHPAAIYNYTPNPKITEPKDLEIARSLAMKVL